MGSVSFGTVSGLVTDAKWFRTDPRCVQPAILSDEHPSAANLVRDSPGHRVGYFGAVEVDKRLVIFDQSDKTASLVHGGIV
jgi:hypothetical protein